MVISELIGGHSSGISLISARGGGQLTAGELNGLIERTVRSLNQAGAGREDRVAVVLPNGPELACAFFAVSACCVFAPLNPAYSEREFEFYLRDLDVQFLITQEGFCDAASNTANALGISILLLRMQCDKAAGSFVLEGGTRRAARLPGLAEANDTALLLHTSGTTARPKLIPLSHKNLTFSALNIAATLGLNPDDRCMNVMPLFHIHGLVGALLASIAAGCPVYCTPGFNALQFMRLLRESDANWYTAVPTMHQMIVGREAQVAGLRQLRFIRSSSAHLSVKIAEQLEDRFGCAALNSYGMTEASHQVSSNPPLPGTRKQGSVGVSRTTRFGILRAGRVTEGPSETGEVVIQGEAVMDGYLVPEEANAMAFHEGWFRTGDLGQVDNDGYLTLRGRIKEIINSGGEKISPAEIDEILLAHPVVASAVCFGASCADLGEKVCAAVVLREGESASEAELKTFARDRLARFKVPRQILIVKDIPRGATGKIQRIGMAKRLGME